MNVNANAGVTWKARDLPNRLGRCHYAQVVQTPDTEEGSSGEDDRRHEHAGEAVRPAV